jgi:hypothetical protein
MTQTLPYKQIKFLRLFLWYKCDKVIANSQEEPFNANEKHIDTKFPKVNIL